MIALQTDRISHHRKFPDVSLDRYVRALQLVLHEFVEPRTTIYLDIKFWISLRDVVLGRPTLPGAVDLLRKLRDGVAAGELLCPICESTFSELMKQADGVTRLATAKLIDELSLGIALTDYFTRANTELACLLHADLPPESRYESDQLVWTKTAYVLGQVHPSNTAFDAPTELALQKAFVDVMWDVTLSDMVEILDLANKPGSGFGELAMSLNDQNEQHADELKSFQQTYEIESQGAVDCLLPVAEQIMQKRFKDKFGTQQQPTEAELELGNNQLRQFLISALNSDQAKAVLRTMHISTALHAYLRWNKGQQWRENHFYDLHHAAAAIGYCELFFTEHGLKGWLTSGLLKLDQVYGCQVASSYQEALTLLASKASDS